MAHENIHHRFAPQKNKSLKFILICDVIITTVSGDYDKNDKHMAFCVNAENDKNICGSISFIFFVRTSPF